MQRLRWTLAATVVVALLAGTAGFALVSHGPAPETRRDPLAVVLGGEASSQVWVVDLRTRSVVRRIDLRSFSLFADVDRATGTIVTAQCGGLGTEADVALGITRGGSATSYVKLPVPNPSDVAVAGGVAVVVHGFQQPDGFVTSAVNLAEGRVATEGVVPATPIRLKTCAGRVLLTTSRDEASGGARGALLEVDPKTLHTRVVARLPLAYAVPVADPGSQPDSPSALVVGFAESRPARERARTSELFRVDLRTGAVLERVKLGGLSAGAFDAAADGSTLAVLDASAAEPANGDGVALFDLRTGAPRARVSVATPAALSAYDGRFLVADGDRGALGFYDDRGRFVGSVALGALGMQADIDVAPAVGPAP